MQLLTVHIKVFDLSKVPKSSQATYAGSQLVQQSIINMLVFLFTVTSVCMFLCVCSIWKTVLRGVLVYVQCPMSTDVNVCECETVHEMSFITHIGTRGDRWESGQDLATWPLVDGVRSVAQDHTCMWARLRVLDCNMLESQVHHR